MHFLCFYFHFSLLDPDSKPRGKMNADPDRIHNLVIANKQFNFARRVCLVYILYII